MNVCSLLQIKYWHIAQSVERLTVNQNVRGSRPRMPAIYGYDDSAFLLQEVAGRFDSYDIHHFVPIAQLGRAVDSKSEGWRFDSFSVRQI